MTEVQPRPTDDVVQPFQLGRPGPDDPQIGGRVVRLGAVVEDILGRHDYPEPVARLLAEALALAAVLAGALKFDGVFTLQIQGDGPVSILVVDTTSDGAMRAYAKIKSDAGDLTSTESPVPHLLGKGHLAFTVDQGPETERYQRIVDLNGRQLADCAQHYFRQTESLDAAIVLAAGRPSEGGWRAGALFLQRLPEEGERVLASDDADDPWRRAMLLLATVQAGEMLDPALDPLVLLYRLFHEDGVRATPPRPVSRGCRCTRARIGEVLKMLPRGELEELKIDGRLEVTCEFCNQMESFDERELEVLLAG